MLRSITVKNFHSISDTPQSLSFCVSSKEHLNDSSFLSHNDDYVNAVSAVIGHNASGKTTILKSLSFLFWFLDNSYLKFDKDKKIPVEPHKLSKSKTCYFEIEFESHNILYKYFIELSNTQIVHEYLGKKVTKGFTRIFELQRSDNDFSLKLPDIELNSKDQERFIENETWSLFSFLKATGYLNDIDIYKKFYSNTGYLGMRANAPMRDFVQVSAMLYKDADLKRNVLTHIKEFDFGISDLDFSKSTFKAFDPKNDTLSQEEKDMLRCVHNVKKSTFFLDLIEESNGTQKALALLTKMLPILASGGILVYDEIEAGLHPYIVRKLISLFENKKTNPKNAQVIFSTHQHMLLNDRTKTQIFLTEKSELLATEVYRLDDIQGIRNDENYFHKYMDGVYGAVPKVDWF